MTETSSARISWGRIFGEFAVIVMGVLVALGVDQAVGDARDRDLEVDYLARLYRDLVENEQELDGLVESWGRVETNARLLMDALSAGSAVIADTVALLTAVNRAGNSYTFRGQDATYQELISSGRLGLLRDQDVRSVLVRYFRSIEFGSGFFTRLETEFRTLSRRAVPPELYLAIQEQCGLGDSRLSTEATRRDPACVPSDVDVDLTAAVEYFLTYPDVRFLVNHRLRDAQRAKVLLGVRLDSTRVVRELFEPAVE